MLVCSAVTPSKITTRAEVGCASDGGKRKRGESASPTNPEKGRAIREMGRLVKSMLVAWPRHSTEDYKLIKEYSKKYAAQRPHTQAFSSGNKNSGKTIKF